MTRFTPLSLRLVQPAWADRVPSPAHDSLSPEQRRAFLSQNPDSYLTVTRSPEDLPVGAAPVSSDDLFLEGRLALDRLVTAGAFSDLHGPRFYAYRLDRDGHQQTGVVGGVSLDDYESGELRVHEQVQTGRTLHLAQHLAVVQAQSSPIAIAHRPEPVVAAILDRVTEATPMVDATGSDGLHQTVWPIDNVDDEAAIVTAFAGQHTYIIDGHHRASAGLAHHKAEQGQASGWILVAAFSSDALLNRAFHRRVTDVSIDQLIDALDGLVWREVDETLGLHEEEVLFYGNGRWVAVKLPHDPEANIVGNLDPVRIEQQVLRSLLGIEPTESGGRLSYLPGNSSVDQLAADVDQQGGVLCISRPVPVELLLAAADDGLVMPPKSTYFEPKVRSGVFVRSTVD